MKSIVKYLTIAALASLTLASCEKEKENEFLNPKGTPVQFTLTGDKTFDGSKANIKVTSDVPVPADVAVTLSLDAAESTVKAANVTFPNLIISAGQTEASGKIELDPAGLEADKTFKVVVKGAVSGVELGQKVSLKYTTDPAPIPDVPVLAIDGIFTEWDAEEDILGEGAMFAMKKIFTEDKLYFYLELDKGSLLPGELAFAHKIHMCFDNGDFAGSLGGNELLWKGARYDEDVDIWLMQNGAPDMITWGLDGFEHKEGADGDMLKFEFCFPRSAKAIFQGDCLRFGAYVDGQYCDTSSGSEVWGGSGDSIGCAPKAELDMVLYGEPHVGGIQIDGDMSDWIGVETGVASEGGPMLNFKATYDEEYVYLYNKRTWHDGLWGSGYYYFYFDTDNNPETGEMDANGNSAPGVECWMYLYVFGGSSAEPAFNANPEGDGVPAESLANIICNGTVDAEHTLIETEVRIPRSNVGIQKGQTVKLYSWGNKSGSNLKGEAVTLVIEN